MQIPDGPGTYVLVMRLEAERTLLVGRLGEARLAPGYYLYVGSALGGLRARLARHLRCEKRRHWHIDYVLEAAHIIEVWYAASPERIECIWARRLAASACLVTAIGRFGASDCACASHLFYAAERPSLGGVTLADDGREVCVLTIPESPAG
jgi:Uri superfamily endonuclease